MDVYWIKAFWNRQGGASLFIISDILLYVSTALVLSITALCILLQVRARDKYSASFLSILVPIALQMGLNMVMTYVNRVYSPVELESRAYSVVCLFNTVLSITLTTIMLYGLSRYLIGLLPEEQERKKTGYRIVNVIVPVFLFLSLFAVFAASKGDWITAMELTLGYHFLCGSVLMSAHGIAALFYMKKATTREEESLLKGIAYTFIPLIITFPLDLLFFRIFSFKLAYLCFSLLVVYLYFFISKNYFKIYDPPADAERSAKALLKGRDLSGREIEIALLVIGGHTNSDIGSKLFISVNTVKTHIKSCYKKLGVNNRVQLLRFVREEVDARLKGAVGNDRSPKARPVSKEN